MWHSGSDLWVNVRAPGTEIVASRNKNANYYLSKGKIDLLAIRVWCWKNDCWYSTCLFLVCCLSEMAGDRLRFCHRILYYVPQLSDDFLVRNFSNGGKWIFAILPYEKYEINITYIRLFRCPLHSINRKKSYGWSGRSGLTAASVHLIKSGTIYDRHEK